MYWQPEATARAVEDAGLRATIGAPLIDAGGGRGEAARRGRSSSLERARRARRAGQRRRWRRTRSTRSARTSLRWIAELGGERGLPVQIHLSETEQEVAGLRRRARRRARPPTSTGSACSASARCSPTASGSTTSELELIAERGATVVTNPVANMKLAVGGVFPYPAARAAGVAVGLGTDGAGSNDSLDLLADLKIFALAPEARRRRPDRVARRRGLGDRHRAPGAAARRQRRSSVGAPADFLLLRAGAPELSIGDLAAGLVYAASGAVVDTTVVAGRVLMRGGSGRRRGEMVARALERARRLGLVDLAVGHVASVLTRDCGHRPVVRHRGAAVGTRGGKGAAGARPARALRGSAQRPVRDSPRAGSGPRVRAPRDRAVDLADLLAALRAVPNR